jgi:predicted MFS family arabinose efflux permease
MSAVADAKKHRPAELGRYWPAVLARFVTAVFAWGFGFSGTSVYLAELHRLHPWSRGLIGMAITTYYLVGAICMTFVHVALRRAGPGRLLAAGTLLLGLGATLFSRSEQPWQLFGAAALMAAGWAGCTTTAIASALAMYFERHLGLAITLALNGASAAGFTVGPLLLILSQAIGVGNAVPLTALAALVIVLPLIGFGLREPPASGFSAAKPDSFGFAAPGILRSWRFWSVTLPFALALAAQVGLIVHLVSFLLPHVGAERAAGALAATSIAAISGRLALATVIDRLPQRVASAVSFASQAGGLALMLLFTNQPTALYAGCITFGLSVGNIITFPALIVQREFPASAFGRVIGLNTAATQFAYALAPALLGTIRDLTGGYAAALLVCIGLQLAGAIIVLAGSRFATSDLRTHEAAS